LYKMLSSEPEAGPSWSGSGVWEGSLHQRWEVVEQEEHRVPGREIGLQSPQVSSSLEISPFVASFSAEQEDPAMPDNIVADGNSLVRLDHNLQSQSYEVEDEEAGPSRRRSKRQKRRNSSNRLEGEEREEETVVEREESGGGREEEVSEGRRQQRQGNKKRKRFWWRRKKVKLFRVARAMEFKNRRNNMPYVSVESSPGRNSPSPDTLRMILSIRVTPPSSPEYFPPSPEIVNLSPHYFCSELVNDIVENIINLSL